MLSAAGVTEVSVGRLTTHAAAGAGAAADAERWAVAGERPLPEPSKHRPVGRDIVPSIQVRRGSPRAEVDSTDA